MRKKVKKLNTGCRKAKRKARRMILTMKRRAKKAIKKIFSTPRFALRSKDNIIRARLELSGLLKKIAAATLVFGLLLQGGGFFIPTTHAYFNDTEFSVQNSLATGSLDVNLSPSGAYVSGLMYPSDATITAFTLSNAGTLAYNYISKIELLGSDKQPCDYISVSASDGTSTYSSLITDFITPTTTPASDVVWNFNFTAATNTPPEVWGQTCYFKWIYSAWQNDLPDFSGFNDTEEKLGSIRIGKAVVLNEFIPNPTGLDTALMPGGEWVELYNNSNREFDLSNWYLFDSTDGGKIRITSARTNTGGTTINPHGYLVVYRDGSSAFVLNNNADSVRLFTGSSITTSVLVDAYTYTEEKPEGFSFARMPDGVGAWVDPIPTPGQPNLKDVDYEALVLANMNNQVLENTASSTLSSLAQEPVAQNETLNFLLKLEPEVATTPLESSSSTSVAEQNSLLGKAGQIQESTTTLEILGTLVKNQELPNQSELDVGQAEIMNQEEENNKTDQFEKTGGINIIEQQLTLLPDSDQTSIIELPASVDLKDLNAVSASPDLLETTKAPLSEAVIFSSPESLASLPAVEPRATVVEAVLPSPITTEGGLNK